MDITALLNQNLAKTGATGQPAAADGEAWVRGTLSPGSADFMAAKKKSLEGAVGLKATSLYNINAFIFFCIEGRRPPGFSRRRTPRPPRRNSAHNSAHNTRIPVVPNTLLAQTPRHNQRPCHW